jgi:hypothetical protein
LLVGQLCEKWKWKARANKQPSDDKTIKNEVAAELGEGYYTIERIWKGYRRFVRDTE